MTDQLMQTSYPWYERVEEDKLEQGDLLDHCRIFIPDYTLADLTGESTSIGQIEIDAQFYDVVIINQTCDLQSKTPLPYVSVCPRWPYNKVIEKHPNFASKATFEEVRKGKQHRFFMLNKCDLFGFRYDVQIVDLAKVFILPFDIVKQFALFKRERIRLRSPYKEKLAQAFAYYYMRVALPVDLDVFDNVNQAQVIMKPAYLRIYSAEPSCGVFDIYRDINIDEYMPILMILSERKRLNFSTE